MVSLGVRFGAKGSNQLENESDGSPSSAEVGMSGAGAERASLVAA
jgi:hypothetical protein